MQHADNTLGRKNRHRTLVRMLLRVMWDTCGIVWDNVQRSWKCYVCRICALRCDKYTFCYTLLSVEKIYCCHAGAVVLR